MELITGWKLFYYEKADVNDRELSSPDYNDNEWYETEVPGDVHSTLLKHRVIEDPFYSTNDAKCQWIDNKFWWYRNNFNYDEILQTGERLELIFEGLDTYATIYLNGEEIGFHQNMFTSRTIDVTHKIKKGRNILALKFWPLAEVVGYRPTNNIWTLFNGMRPWVRKAAMTFGWDWGPKLITVGIWKKVRLEKRQFAKIETVHLKSKNIDPVNHTARVELEIGVDNFNHQKDLRLFIIMKDESGDCFSTQHPVLENIEKLSIELKDAKLWWPHDIGIPHLYQVKVVLQSKENPIDCYETEFGIRDIQVKLFDDVYKTRFTFIVNGVPIFAKGANWIPAHNLIGSIGETRYIQLLEMVRSANMNMLRVWGGGIYEKEIFYRTCDRLGILVWQDFMFACSEYPDFDGDFMKLVAEEITQVVIRLRNHSSIALWVGNNENQQLHYVFLGPKPFRELYGRKIYEELMPKMLKELDDTRLFWPGSAYGGEDPQNQEIGDRHNWDVWHGGAPTFKKYADDKTRFCSEFGLHAAPVKYTLERNIPEDKLYLDSFELDYRNKDLNPDKVKTLMAGYTGIPQNVDQYIDYSMLLQAEGLKYGVEHFRRRFPETSGSLIWQLNDCWPGQSWSIIDYYLYPKTSYFYAKRFFTPILLSFKEEENDAVSIWVSNNSLLEYEDQIVIGVRSFMGQVFYEESLQVNVPAHSSRMVKFMRIGGGFGTDVIVFQKRWLFAFIKPNQSDVLSNEYFFKEFKDCKFPDCRLKIEFERIDKGLQVKISSDVFARFVKIEFRMDGTSISDNYFNIYPGDTKIVNIHHETIRLSPEMFSITALNSERND